MAMSPPSTRTRWRAKASFFHEEDERYLRYLIPPGSHVLELGCGAGHTLAALQPSVGVGIDLNPQHVAEGKAAFPHLQFYLGDVQNDGALAQITGTFDFILLHDVLGALRDCQALLERLHRFATRETRIICAYYSHVWQPALSLAEWLHRKAPQPESNVLAPADVQNLARLAGFEVISSERRLLSPFRAFGLGRLANRLLAPLPLVRHLTLRHYTVSRSLRCPAPPPRSATVVIPARNERGNIAAAIDAMPRFCDDIEVIFVEGHSRDGTLAEIHRVAAQRSDWNIRILEQPGIGKADAVWAGFDAARNDVLMILDADLTVAPEHLSKFWNVVLNNQGEFVNGSRLVYRQGEGAMQFLNLIANRLFSVFFSWLLGQRYTDTLCGTKVLRRTDYLRLSAGRAYFGDFDPFGDFDLIFGAAKLGLKTIEVPVPYRGRTYGTTQISRFRHGLILLRMAGFALLKIKAL